MPGHSIQSAPALPCPSAASMSEENPENPHPEFRRLSREFKLKTQEEEITFSEQRAKFETPKKSPKQPPLPTRSKKKVSIDPTMPGSWYTLMGNGRDVKIQESCGDNERVQFPFHYNVYVFKWNDTDSEEGNDLVLPRGGHRTRRHMQEDDTKEPTQAPTTVEYKECFNQLVCQSLDEWNMSRGCTGNNDPSLNPNAGTILASWKTGIDIKYYIFVQGLSGTKSPSIGEFEFNITYAKDPNATKAPTVLGMPNTPNPTQSPPTVAPSNKIIPTTTIPPTIMEVISPTPTGEEEGDDNPTNSEETLSSGGTISLISMRIVSLLATVVLAALT